MKDQIKALEGIINSEQQDLSQEEAQLKLNKKSLLTKKVLLKQMLKKANHVPFFRTRTGSYGLRALRTVTRPFARLNSNVHLALETPLLYQAQELTEQASKVITKCESIPDNQHKHAKKFAVQAAEMFTVLEDFAEATTDFEGDFTVLVSSLRAQFTRLRPVQDEQKLAALKQEIDSVISV